MKYKKYIVFSFDNYYPRGGLEDIKESFYTLKAAVDYASESEYDESEIADRDTWTIVYRGNKS